MIFCKELNKSFDSKKELFKALKKNKKRIIDHKKSQIQKSCDKGHVVKFHNIDLTKFKDQIKGVELDSSLIHVAVNTTKILDSHEDYHKNGIWNKTVQEQQGKNYLVMDHELKMTSRVVDKSKVKMSVVEMPFKALGKNYEGNTQALIYSFKEEDVKSKTALDWIKEGDDIEASVRMQYVKVDLAMNDDEEGSESYLKNYNENINDIANKEDFESVDYFWIVSEAKNVMESSLVMAGSNPVTGVVPVSAEKQTDEDCDCDPDKDEDCDCKDKNKKKPSFDTSKLLEPFKDTLPKHNFSNLLN